MSLLDDMFEKEAEIAPAKPKLLDLVVAGMVPTVSKATGISHLLGGGANTDQQMEQDVLGDLLDPAHESEMQSIRMQAMLTEFLADDPVISTYDPEQVIDAFNQIAQMTPRASMQPAVMRGQLRKMLQQQDAMEPFEASQLVEVEKGLKSVQEPSKLPLAPIPGLGDTDDR